MKKNKQEKLDKELNRKLRRLQKAFSKGRFHRNLYEQKRSRLISTYYEKSQKLEQDETKKVIYKLEEGQST